jgi:hypothetical protein
MNEPPYTIELKGTPSPDDPPNADDFYQFLGMAIVAWGRLEGHFAASPIMALKLSQDNARAGKFPLAWESRSKVWRILFTENASLAPQHNLAISLIDQIDELAKQRHLIIHGLWESFVPGEPIKMQFIDLGKPTKEETSENRQGVVASRRCSIDLAGLTEFVVQANRLNIELFPIHQFLTDGLAALRSKTQISGLPDESS